MLKDLAPAISKLLQGNNLTSNEVKDIFVTTSKEDSEGYYYLAFAAGLMAKGLSEDELFGLVLGLQEFSVQLKTRLDAEEITDLSGSGGDQLRTFNVSTAASFIVAAAGVKVAKQSFVAFTSFTGSSDILQELGIVLPKTPVEMVTTLEKIGIAPLNYPYLYSGMDTRLKAVAKFREIGLQFPTPMHPIALVPSPLKMTKRTYGIFAEKYMVPVSKIFQRLGYQHGLVMFGEDGLDEISTIGKTKIVEFTANKYREYEITPKDLGIRSAKPEEITVQNKDDSIKSFLCVLYGKEEGAKQDIVAANAGASLYIMGKAQTLKGGVELAKSLIADKLASKKLEELIDYTGGSDALKRLSDWKMKAQI